MTWKTGLPDHLRLLALLTMLIMGPMPQLYGPDGLQVHPYEWYATVSDGTATVNRCNMVIHHFFFNCLHTTICSRRLGAITQPTCVSATGSVVLNGLPEGSWTINPGAITGSGVSTTITGLNAGTYNFTVTTSIGCTSEATSNVVINAQPLPPVRPGAITGNTTSLSGSCPDLQYCCRTGCHIIYLDTAFRLEREFRFNFDNCHGRCRRRTTFRCTANNSCGTSTPRSLNVMVQTIPAQPGAITGNTAVCQGVSQTYSIAAVAGATSYTWTLPSGWSGSSSATSITATAGANSGNISVTANNSCGSGTQRTLSITATAIPSQPGTITGASSVCVGSSQTYSIAAVPGATSYTWTLPSGWSGSSVSTSITATAGASGGNISVTANNTCGSGDIRTLNISVSDIPSQPGAITGNTTVCQGAAQTYSIAAVPGATSYTWTLPSGWSGSSGSTSINATGRFRRRTHFGVGK